MSEPWMPSLTVREHGHRCRLQLAGDAWGTGETLQDAADDLVARVLQHAQALRGDGWVFGPELGAPDQRWLEFLYEVGEIAERGGDERGGDVRRRVLGGA